MSESPISEVIRIFENGIKERVVTIKPIEGGTSYLIYQINLFYVFRYKKANYVDEPFFAPAFECELLSYLSKAKEKSICPILFGYALPAGHMVNNYIEEGEIDDGRDQEYRLYASLLDSLKVLHETKIDKNPAEFAPFERFRHYKKLSEESFALDFEERILEKAKQALDDSRRVICHNHLCKDNFFFDASNRRVRLNGFQFASYNGEIFDIASLLEENNIEGRLKERLIHRYYGVSEVSDILLGKIDDVIAFLDLLWYYYAKARYKETMEQAFLDIAKEKMGRIRRYIGKKGDKTI